MDYLANHIEALVFCSPTPVSELDIQNCLREMFDTDVPVEDIRERLDSIVEKFGSDDFSFELMQSGGGYQFLTKPAYQASIGILLKQQSKKRLSNTMIFSLSK